MKRINKLIIFALMLLVSVSAVFADDIATATTTIGLDLSEYGYFKVWFTDEDNGAHPDIKDLEKSTSLFGNYGYYTNFFLRYEAITTDEIKVNLSSSGPLKTSEGTDTIDYYVSGFDGELYPAFGIKEETKIAEYETGVDIAVTKDSDNKASGKLMYSVMLAKEATGAEYSVYTSDIIAKVIVN